MVTPFGRRKRDSDVVAVLLARTRGPLSNIAGLVNRRKLLGLSMNGRSCEDER